MSKLVKLTIDEELWLKSGVLRHAVMCPCYHCKQSGRQLEMKRAKYLRAHPEDKNMVKARSGQLAAANKKLKRELPQKEAKALANLKPVVTEIKHEEAPTPTIMEVPVP